MSGQNGKLKRKKQDLVLRLKGNFHYIIELPCHSAFVKTLVLAEFLLTSSPKAHTRCRHHLVAESHWSEHPQGPGSELTVKEGRDSPLYRIVGMGPGQ